MLEREFVMFKEGPLIALGVEVLICCLERFVCSKMSSSLSVWFDVDVLIRSTPSVNIISGEKISYASLSFVASIIFSESFTPSSLSASGEIIWLVGSRLFSESVAVCSLLASGEQIWLVAARLFTTESVTVCSLFASGEILSLVASRLFTELATSLLASGEFFPKELFALKKYK